MVSSDKSENSQSPQELMKFDITIWQVLLVNKAEEAGSDQTAGAGLLLHCEGACLHCERDHTYLLKYEHSLGDA